jgi:hypothetical protein
MLCIELWKMIDILIHVKKDLKWIYNNVPKIKFNNFGTMGKINKAWGQWALLK